MSDAERERWLAVVVQDRSNDGSWQTRDFGPWYCVLNETRRATRAEAVEEALRVVGLAPAQESRGPVWSAGPPTAPGFYWHRYTAGPHPEEPEIVLVQKIPTGLLFFIEFGSDAGGETDFRGEWCGPIQPPQ
jgi:hypothetical protein